ncbi:MAG: protein-disulfide reductase DsbD domain-containing protein [Pseudomonadota bacterium]
MSLRISYVSLMSMGDRKRRVAALVRALTLSAMAGALALPAQAQQVVSRGESFLSAQLLPGGRLADGRQSAALVLKMRPGWKTYWRQPGEAGVPPMLDWTGSGNLADIEVGWPAPEVFESFGYTTLGYGDRVVLPLTLTPTLAGEPVTLRLEGTLGVCKDICVFEQVSETVAVPSASSSIHDGAIAAARDAMPDGPAVSGVHLVACRIAGAGKARQVSARFLMPAAAVAGGPLPLVIVEGPEGSWVEPPSLAAAEDGAVTLEAVLRLGSAEAWVGRGDLRFTLLATGIAAEIEGCIPTTG